MENDEHDKLKPAKGSPQSYISALPYLTHSNIFKLKSYVRFLRHEIENMDQEAPEFIQTRILHFLPCLESNPPILVSHIWRLSEGFFGRPLVAPRSTSKGLIWLTNPSYRSFLRRSVGLQEDRDFFPSGHDGCRGQ